MAIIGGDMGESTRGELKRITTTETNITMARRCEI
jgi:hypothetical protein